MTTPRPQGYAPQIWEGKPGGDTIQCEGVSNLEPTYRMRGTYLDGGKFHPFTRKFPPCSPTYVIDLTIACCCGHSQLPLPPRPQAHAVWSRMVPLLNRGQDNRGYFLGWDYFPRVYINPMIFLLLNTCYISALYPCLLNHAKNETAACFLLFLAQYSRYW